MENLHKDYNFYLDNFEGPLDVLLYLAKSNQIEIKEISLNILIDQYIYYIRQVEKLGINIASKYIEMAADLIRLKSNSLLPQFNIIDEQVEMDLTKEDIINKLLEYKKYKEIIGVFEEKHLDNQNRFYKEADSLTNYRQKTFENSLTTNKLKAAILNMKIKTKQDFEINKKIKIKKHDLKKFNYDVLNLKEKVNFYSYTADYSISEKTVVFLIILDNIKKQKLSFSFEDYMFYIFPKVGKDNEK